MNNFITNDDSKELKERLLELIHVSKELKFLVGFFYFSGIQELYQGLKENPDVILKVLVGMNIDTANFKLLEFAEYGNNTSDSDKSEKLLGDIRLSLAHEDFDTPTFYKQIAFIIDLIQKDRLIIRKTRDPNHAKIYFFHTTEKAKSKLFITGSSNLTRPALTTQAEFNVEISDYGAKETEAYFDALWDDAVKITERDEVKLKLIKVIEKGTLVRKITPFEAYVLALKTYIESFKQEKISPYLIDVLKKNDYTPFTYQLDAVRQALAVIKDNNGVIIADVVGLGKTIIACSVALALRRRGLVICPPGLMGDKNKKSGWRMYLEQFGLHDWEVRSLGDLEATAEYIQDKDDFEVVIVDEVHRFRNQDTRDYEQLKNICRNKIVILLTATPFNNRPADILSLLKLFITPKKSSITLAENLVGMFRTYKTTFDQLSYISRYHKSSDPRKRSKVQANYAALFGEDQIDLAKVRERTHTLANEIRDVIQPVTIRRNRLDLKNNPFYKDEVKNLSVIADPQEWFYELTPEQSKFYDLILTKYFGSEEEGGQFIGAIYRPFKYETAQEEDKFSERENFEFVQQHELYEFMRRLLVKRFESSFGSFEQSIRRFQRITENALTFIKKTNKFILDRALMEKIYTLDEELIEAELDLYTEKMLKGNYPKTNKVYKLDEFAYRSKFLEDIHSDLELYKTIITELDQMHLVEEDPKSRCLVAEISKVLSTPPLPGEPKRKVVIFSEYLDTVKHLEKTLVPLFRNRVLVVAGNLNPKLVQEINKNFDASAKNPSDDYDILLSTDRISEGFNLNRAGMVINYDIPWNPVRVIQRVGRINRISKKVFNELNIVNFFPSERGAELVKSREIAGSKMFLIHNILGEDAKIFDVDETPSPSGLFTRLTQNPEELEQESFYTQMLKLYEDIKAKYPDLITELADFPPRVKVAKMADENELLVLFKKGRLYIQTLNYANPQGTLPAVISFEQAFPKIECGPDAETLQLSSQFWDKYTQAKKVKEIPERAGGAKSIETQALNNLKTLLRNSEPALSQHRQFLTDLVEDIRDYGTLADFTLRTIANWDSTNPARLSKLLRDIAVLKHELGEDFLKQEIARYKEAHEEIIIAIENQKP